MCGAAGRIGATLVNQKADQTIHRRIIRAADQCRHLSLLRDEAGQDKPVQMMGERGCGERQLPYNCPTGSPASPALTSDR
jgi:hypothetical protein